MSIVPEQQPFDPISTPPAPDKASGLRVALFSGNYNCIRDGANKALNRLVRHLLDRGAAVRIYSPTVRHPAFEPTGDLVSVPSIGMPLRPEYKLATGLPERIRKDIVAFQPTLFHLSAPDILGTKAQAFARELGVPVVTSMHTRFETYFGYYGFGFVRAWAEHHLRRFYQNSDFVLAPNEPFAEELREQGLGDKVRIWGRGVDHQIFNPTRRDVAWRRGHGFADDEAVVLFFGRLVLEKGTDVFEAIVGELRARGRRVRPLVVGDGPAAQAMAARLGSAVFAGHLAGAELARAIASADILVNPSVTEAFGNVNLEAMASGLAIVSADVASAQALVEHERTGLLVPPRSIAAYADAVEQLIDDPRRRYGLAQRAARAALAYRWSTTLDAVLETYRVAVDTAEPPARITARAPLPLAWWADRSATAG